MGAGRILILNERDPRHPRAGGAEIHVTEIFGRLARRGFEVTHLASAFPGAPVREVVDDIEVRRVGGVPLHYLRAARVCRRETAAGRFDLVVECLNKLPYYAPAYACAPVLAICHHLFGEAAFAQVAWPVAAGVWLAERPLPLLYRRARFIAISESSREDLVARGLPVEATEVIPCGIRKPLHPGSTPVSRRPPTVVYVGRVEPYKRVDVMLRAVAELRERFPGIRGVVMGEGRALPALQRLAGELGLQACVRFTGFVPDEERDRVLAEARVCVCPSIKEGWGLTVIEANAVGTPVVATDAPGLRDSVRDGETGFLVPEGDVGAFADRIGRLLEDDALAERLSAGGRRWAAGFDWDRVASAVEARVRWMIDAARGDGRDGGPR